MLLLSLFRSLLLLLRLLLLPLLPLLLLPLLLLLLLLLLLPHRRGHKYLRISDVNFGSRLFETPNRDLPLRVECDRCARDDMRHVRTKILQYFAAEMNMDPGAVCRLGYVLYMCRCL
jgi:hypothetical protein